MSQTDRIADLSAAAIGRALAAGEVTSSALTEILLGRIEAHGDHVFITVTPERARSEAKAADARLAAGRPLSALDGVPIAWKDLFDLEGEVTTAGSETRRNAPPAETDCTVAKNLRAAGMVSLGKVNLTEFAYSGLGLNPHFGTPKNPCDPDTPRVPGGSSSGSGVAIAAGLAPCAMGTDTGGSIRIPAALNGIFGYKPSSGRISTAGVFPLSRSLDTVGPLARSCEDLVLLDALLRGLPAPQNRRAGLKGLQVFVPESVVLDGVEDAVMAAFEMSLARLKAAGARVTRGPFAPFEEAAALAAAHGSLAAADAYVEHYEVVEGPDLDLVDRRVTDRILGGKRMSARDVVLLQRARARLIDAVHAEIGTGLIAMPTVAHVAPEIAPLEADVDHFHAVNLKTLRNTMMGNFLDLAGISIPNGRDARGLPTGILLSAASGQDDTLLSLAQSLETVVASFEIQTD